MASVSALRAALLGSFSVLVTVLLGFGLPSLLNLGARALGLPETSVTECIVALYLGFVLYVATPRIPRGSVKDKGAEGAKELEELCSDRLKVVQLDVCSDEQVDQAVKYVKENLGDTETSLWAVVNNAGVSTFGEIEFTSMDTYRRVSEVNLWGTVRVTKAFLPLIRRAKGRVVNVASMSGRMGCPSQSAYCVSKYGVEAFSDCLRYEMKAWGVKVSVIEPGNFLAATSIMTRDSVAVTAAKLWREAPTQVQEDYGKARFEIHMAATRSHCNTGQKDAASVLDDITDAVVSKRPYTRYHPMEPHSWLRVQLMTHLPGAMSDFLYF
uniref:3-hydroxybutyrate dehydrogenase, type 1 n=1 Tax=Gasterosteus aculeatus aculeatus TaxID=481459 RepID=A0AAQ4NQJ2_GASAC